MYDVMVLKNIENRCSFLNQTESDNDKINDRITHLKNNLLTAAMKSFSLFKNGLQHKENIIKMGRKPGSL